MNYKLQLVLIKILDDEKLSQDFFNLDSMDDMYEFCQKIGTGYNEEEFDESIAELISYLNHPGIDKLNEKELNLVAGGFNAKNALSKTIASVLSALAIGSATGLPSAFAANTSPTQPDSSAVGFTEKISDKWNKTKEALSNFYKNHKKAVWIIVGTVAALTATAVIAYVGYNKYQKHMEEKAKLKKDLEALKQEKERLEAANKEIQEEKNKATAELAEAQQQAKEAAQQANTSKEQKEALESEKARIESQLKELEEKDEASNQEKEALTARLGEIAEQFEDAQRAATQADANVQEAQKRADEAQGSIERLTGEISDLQAKSERDQQKLQAEIDKVTQERDKAKSALKRATDSTKANKKELLQKQATIDDNTKKLASAEKAAQISAERERALNDQIAKAEEQKKALEVQKSDLEEKLTTLQAEASQSAALAKETAESNAGIEDATKSKISDAAKLLITAQSMQGIADEQDMNRQLLQYAQELQSSENEDALQIANMIRQRMDLKHQLHEASDRLEQANGKATHLAGELETAHQEKIRAEDTRKAAEDAKAQAEAAQKAAYEELSREKENVQNLTTQLVLKEQERAAAVNFAQETEISFGNIQQQFRAQETTMTERIRTLEETILQKDAGGVSNQSQLAPAATEAQPQQSQEKQQDVEMTDSAFAFSPPTAPAAQEPVAPSEQTQPPASEPFVFSSEVAKNPADAEMTQATTDIVMKEPHSGSQPRTNVKLKSKTKEELKAKEEEKRLESQKDLREKKQMESRAESAEQMKDQQQKEAAKEGTKPAKRGFWSWITRR